MGLNQFKTEIVKGQIYANTNVDGALTYLEKVREKLRTSKGGSTALEGEIVNRPIKPSEMFLARNGNVFPIAELQNRLAKVEHSVKLVEKRVELFFDPEAKETNGVNYKIDTKGDLVAVNDFPWKGNSREGCAVIYELPHVVDGRVPENSYIIGHDPYAKDDPFGDSLGSVYVVKTKAHFNTIGHDEVVASYIGRPFEGRKKINEVMYKLSMFYGNAKIYFENVRGNVKEYFESIGRLDLLAHKPLTIFSKKASYMSSQTQQEYGYPMSSRDMKIKVMRLLRDWLIEERSKDDDKVIRNLDLICDVGLLKELINFNYDGNFDRVMGFAGCVIGLNAMTLQTLEEQEEELEAQDEFHKFLVNNKNLFKPSITTNSKAQHKYLLGFNN